MLAAVRSEPAFGFMVVALIVVFGPTLAQRAGLPGLIGLLVGGAVIGPEVLGVLPSPTGLEAFGEIGVLYLVFLAGLELDLKTFQRYRRASLSFGLVTAALPWALGLGVALAFDFDLRPAVLIGSFWASFTLVSYGVVSRYQLTRVPSVAATVGASAITDTIGLVALAVIVGAETGESNGIRLGVEIAAGLAGVALFAIVVLPVVVRWFFAGLGQERELRFVMVLAGFTSAAAVAVAFGVEGLIGAFFAGIGLNRLVPNRSALMARTAFFGNALFIPVFIVSVGLLVDPEVIADPRTLALAAGFALALLVGKAVAAVVVSQRYGFTRPETGLMFSLSSAQAAATLASTIIGFEIGLYEADVVNAVVVVIVISLLVSAVGSERFAARIDAGAGTDRRLGETIVVVSNGDTDVRGLLAVAGRLAESDGGVIVPVVVSTDDPADLSAARDRIAVLDADLRGLGLTGEARLRVDRSIAGGVARITVEHDASLVLVPCPPDHDLRRALFGTTIDEIAASADRPVALTSVGRHAIERVVVVLEDDDLSAPNVADAAMTIEVAALVAAGAGVPTVLGPVDPSALAAHDLDLPAGADVRPGSADARSWLAEHGAPGDLVVTGARGRPHARLASVAGQGRSAVVASARNRPHWYAPEGGFDWARRSDGGSAVGVSIDDPTR